MAEGAVVPAHRLDVDLEPEAVDQEPVPGVHGGAPKQVDQKPLLRGLALGERDSKDRSGWMLASPPHTLVALPQSR